MNRQKPEDVLGQARPRRGRSPGRNISKACATAARSISTASASRTSPRIRRSAMPRARIARLYDALHDPKQKDVLTCPTDTGSGGFTHKFFRVAHSREDLIGQRDAIAALGAHVLRLDGAHAGLQGVADEHARRQCARSTGSSPTTRSPGTRASQDHVLFMNHAIVNPPVDRSKAADQVKDVFITIQKETDAGIVRVGRQGGGDLVGDHALQFPRPERRDADQRHRSRGDVHRADERAGREADLPHLLRDDGERDGHAVRLSAVVALRRERRDLRVRQRADPLGERAAPPRHREDQGVLSALGLPRTATSSRAARGLR